MGWDEMGAIVDQEREVDGLIYELETSAESWVKREEFSSRAKCSRERDECTWFLE